MAREQREYSSSPKESGKSAHKRNVAYREKYYSPEMDLQRKLKTFSFKPIVEKIFKEISLHEGPVKAAELAWRCQSCWSEGLVYAHLRWLADFDLLTRKYDGGQLWFDMPPQKVLESCHLFRALVAALGMDRKCSDPMTTPSKYAQRRYRR